MDEWHDPAAVAEWDARAAESPARERQLELLLDVLTAAAPRTVLEVGVGSGIVARRVLEALPGARLVGVDGSEAMLALAGERLAPFAGRVELVCADLREPAAIRLPPPAPDTAYSVQTLHHLPDGAKAEVFRWLGAVLPRGALFLLRDKVTVEPALFDAFAAVWRATGAPMPATAAAYAASLCDKHDVPGSLAAHLGWLEQAGFAVGVPHAEGHYVLVAAARR